MELELALVFERSHFEILGSESFTRWLVGCKSIRVHGHEREQGYENNVLVSPLPVSKRNLNEFDYSI